MPFDGKLKAKPDLTKPSLEGLSYLLRQEMPVGFTWDFAKISENTHLGCGTAGCAVGLASRVWGGRNWYSQSDCWFPSTVYAGLLYSSEIYGPDHTHDDVTPHMVADAIDYWLEHKCLPAPGELARLREAAA